MPFKKKKISAYEALYEAQKIAFAPVIFQVVRSLRDLGILSLLEQSGKLGLTAQNISQQLHLSKYSVQTLLESGLSCHVVEHKDQPGGRYEDAVFLLSKTGHYILNDDMTKANMDFNHDVCYHGLGEIDNAFKNNKPEGLKVFGDKWDTIYEALPHLPDKVRKSWDRFDHYYSDSTYPLVLPTILKKQPKTIVDIGTNKGDFAILMAKSDPDINITMIDLPDQLEIAKKNIAKAGISNRVTAKAMNVLDPKLPFPEERDIYWISQFASCFAGSELVSIFQRIATAMTHNSRLFILETCWDRQQHEAAAYSLINTSPYFTCMANGNSKMYHSEELLSYATDAGLEVVNITDNLGICHSLFECRLAGKNA